MFVIRGFLFAVSLSINLATMSRAEYGMRPQL